MSRFFSFRILSALTIAAMLATSLPGTAVAATPIFKLPFVCGQAYIGYTYDGHGWAIDFHQSNNADKGDPVLASAAGTVIDDSQATVNGQITIDHGGGWQTVYAHMTGVAVRRDQTVARGQLLGYVGAVGDVYGTDPDHLHYQQMYYGDIRQSLFDGVAYQYGTWVTSTNCGGLAAPALFADQGDGSARLFRWKSTGSSFGSISTFDTGAWTMGAMGDRFAAGNVDGKGGDDIVVAYQNSDGTFSFHVWLNGITYAGKWYTSGQLSLSRVAGRMAVGDFTGDGRAEPAIFYDEGNGTSRIYRWTSTGTSFGSIATFDTGAWTMGAMANRFEAGNVDGRGGEDIVVAYQNSDGTFSYHVWLNGITYDGKWYTSGQLSLSRVAGRFAVGDFTGDGRAEPAIFYDEGDGTSRIYRWSSTGSTFGSIAIFHTGAWTMGAMGNRFEAGNVDGRGGEDITVAYQNPDGTFSFHVWLNGITYDGKWYTSGQFGLGWVAGRMAVGAW